MNTKAVVDHIISWMKDYLIQSGQKGFVVGISGGIDSAVVSTLAARTGFPLICLDLPIHQASEQQSRAQSHMEFLAANYNNISNKSIDLTSAFNHLIEQFASDAKQEQIELAEANVRARLRMTTLYYYAGLKSYIVAGTGNKVEDFGVGFFTKYGDGGVDISPIADLMKSQVYKIADELNILPEIRIAPPTDGLWGDDRTDEDQIGASYDELEWAMKEYSRDKSPGDFEGRKKEVMQIYTSYHKANKHKMIAIPICNIPEELL